MRIDNIVEWAMEMTILDAMNNGHKEKNELIQYMKSNVFKSSVNEYVDLFKKEFD